MRDVSGTMVRDSLSELVAAETTALLVVDVQNDFCHDDGHFARHGKDMVAVKAVFTASLVLKMRSAEIFPLVLLMAKPFRAIILCQIFMRQQITGLT